MNQDKLLKKKPQKGVKWACVCYSFDRSSIKRLKHQHLRKLKSRFKNIQSLNLEMHHLNPKKARTNYNPKKSIKA